MNMGNIIALIKSLGGGSVPKPLTYDYMPEGYPSKSEWSIEWDGNTEGLVAVEINGNMLYKVSDLTPTDDEVLGATAALGNGETIEATREDIEPYGKDITIILSPVILVVRKDNSELEGYVFPQKGTYFMKDGEFYVAKFGKQTITPMAEEFLPPSIKPSGKVYKFYSESGTSAPQHISDDGTIGALVTWDEAKQAYEEWLNGEASIRILIYKRLTEGDDNTWANPIAVRQRAADSSGSTFDIVFDTMYGGSLKQALVPYSS